MPTQPTARVTSAAKAECLPTDVAAAIAAAAGWMQRGQASEAQPAPGHLAAAIECYDRAIALLRSLPVEKVRRPLAFASMNRGNALQKQGPAGAAEAVGCYDETIRLLLAAGSPATNTLGAAWMNRGHARQRIGTPADLMDAVTSLDRAIALLAQPAGEPDRSCRINLAASWLNRAHVLLAMSPPDPCAANESTRAALDVVRPLEADDLTAAELGVKVRLVRCAALAANLPAADGSRASAASGIRSAGSSHGTGEPVDWPCSLAEIGDTFEEGLALVRQWERKGIRVLRPFAAPLARFGARFYLTHQRHFLAEFILEMLDPDKAEGATPDDVELHRTAAEVLAQALADTCNLRLAAPDGAEAERMSAMARDLRAAENRRAELAVAWDPREAAGCL